MVPVAAWLTLKYPATGIARHEFEYTIPTADAQALLERSDASVIKQRYGLDLPGGDWVLDVFEAANAPLVMAEVELERAGQRWRLPPWCQLRDHGRRSLSNAALAQRPVQPWAAGGASSPVGGAFETTATRLGFD